VLCLPNFIFSHLFLVKNGQARVKLVGLMIARVISAVWGQFKGDEARKFAYLSIASFLLVGAQWPLHILRDSIFINTVGSLSQPTAKIMALFICLPVTLLYTFIVGIFPKEKALYCIAALLSVLSAGFAWTLYLWTHGQIANQALLGWAFYAFSDTFSVLTVAPFWAFVNDISYPGEAKRGYGMIVFFAQLGGLTFTALNSVLSRYSAASYSSQMPFIVMTSVALLLAFTIPIWKTMHVVRSQNLTGYKVLDEENEPESKNVGFFSGIRAIVSNPYVLGIFVLTSFQEVLSTIISYRVFRVIEITYSNPYMRHLFLFDYALMIQVIATGFALFGTSFFQQRFGIRACMIGYPILLAVCVSITSFSTAIYFVAAAAAAAKALNFSLNKPVREVLYIPTSRDVKYKSKAWIEIFGSRMSKFGSSMLNKKIGEIPMLAGSVAIALAVVWTFIAEKVGTTYHRTVSDRVRIG
jgi:ATP:ADP antiporter, AAA family